MTKRVVCVDGKDKAVNVNIVSIIITSMKDEVVTLESLKLDIPHEIIISKKHGLGLARNWGAGQARGDLLVFLDDDLILHDGFWNEVLKVKEGEFSMPANPIRAQVLVIHKSDFRRVNGFDERIIVAGEDADFYFRALRNGLKFRIFPSNVFTHITHPPYRIKNIHRAIRGIRENITLVIKYGKIEPKLVKDFLFGFLWENMKKLKIRTLIIGLTLLPYCLYKKDY